MMDAETFEQSLDMREIKPGCALDEFHFEMWAGFLRFALMCDEIRAEFEAETGAQFARPDKTIDPNDWLAGYVAKFAAWVTPLYWGGPEYLSPAIIAKLAA